MMVARSFGGRTGKPGIGALAEVRTSHVGQSFTAEVGKRTHDTPGGMPAIADSSKSVAPRKQAFAPLCSIIWRTDCGFREG